LLSPPPSGVSLYCTTRAPSNNQPHRHHEETLKQLPHPRRLH